MSNLRDHAYRGPCQRSLKEFRSLTQGWTFEFALRRCPCRTGSMIISPYATILDSLVFVRPVMLRGANTGCGRNCSLRLS